MFHAVCWTAAQGPRSQLVATEILIGSTRVANLGGTVSLGSVTSHVKLLASMPLPTFVLKDTDAVVASCCRDNNAMFLLRCGCNHPDLA